jgi:hypothetical protein
MNEGPNEYPTFLVYTVSHIGRPTVYTSMLAVYYTVRCVVATQETTWVMTIGTEGITVCYSRRLAEVQLDEKTERKTV